MIDTVSFKANQILRIIQSEKFDFLQVLLQDHLFYKKEFFCKLRTPHKRNANNLSTLTKMDFNHAITFFEFIGIIRFLHILYERMIVFDVSEILRPFKKYMKCKLNAMMRCKCTFHSKRGLMMSNRR